MAFRSQRTPMGAAFPEKPLRLCMGSCHYEDAHAKDVPTKPTTVPLGLANFANDFQSIRPFAQRDHKNIVSWNVYDTGSHHATQDAPALLVGDIRKFFRPLRQQQ